MIVGGIVKKILPIIFRKLMLEIPALRKLDRLVSYMEDDNELDLAVKSHRIELDVLKDQVITLNDEMAKLMKEGKK